MFKKVIASVALAGAVVSVSAGILSPITAFAGPPEGAATLSVAGGTGATAFNITLPAGASCSGNGAANYRWETFIASSSIDVSTLIFTDGPNQPAGTFTSSLTDTSGNLVKQKFPGAGGLISAIPQFNFSSLVGSGITAGAFKVGVFCADLNSGGTVGRIDAGHYWETLITVTNPATLAWSFGAAPAAPVLGALTGALSSFTGSFTSAAATPAVGANGYVVTAVPTAGTGFPGATVTQSFSATGAFTFSNALANATTYSVTMTAANAAGTSPVSNTQTVLVNPPACGAVSGLGGAAAPNSVVLNWTAPVACAGATLASYTVTSPTAPGSPFTVAAGTTTLTVLALTPGTGYTFSVIGIYNAPYVGTAATVGPIAAASNALIYQDINVNRPVGALVLTQRCGAFGALPIEAASPGFAALPAVAGPLPSVYPYSGSTPGTAPTVGGINVLNGPLDPNFSEYPYPVDANGVPNPTYSTHCGVNLGIGQLITSGTLAGQYFTATGAINQVTVVDTRDTDPGWVVNGNMSDFVVAGGGASFSGNYLGWTPVLTDDSDTTYANYNQTVAAGTTVLPANNAAMPNTAGLATNKVLGTSAPTVGLGIATFDARLKLLIPLTARNGDYTGTLTFSAV